MPDAKEKAKGADPIEATWTATAAGYLRGRTIVSVRYMTREEANRMGWSSRPLVIRLDDGTAVYAASDDEGNEGGALFLYRRDRGEGTIPVIQS